MKIIKSSVLLEEIAWPTVSQDGAKIVERRHLLLIRHGESTWNDTFNKGHERSRLVFTLGFIPNLILALLTELSLLLQGLRDSWFYDSPLSKKGMVQCDQFAGAIRRQLAGQKSNNKGPSAPAVTRNMRILNGDLGKRKIVCSSLRRAISTLGIGLRDGLLNNGGNEKIIILSCLQEISRNPDTLSLTPAGQQPLPSWLERAQKAVGGMNLVNFYKNMLDTTEYNGNKSVKSTGLLRLNAFARWCFQPSNSGHTIVVGGHSLYFRTFFRVFLARKSKHIAKRKKIVNGGCVSLELLRLRLPSGDDVYHVTDESVSVVYGGFE
eukprot:g1416.t1